MRYIAGTFELMRQFGRWLLTNEAGWITITFVLLILAWSLT